MAKASASYKNVSGHPLDAGGQVLGTDEFAKLDPDDETVQAAVAAGQLAPQGEPAKKEA